MYEWQGDVLYNGKPINWNITPGVVAKEVIFSWNMPFKYLIDDNEPKCILSPSRLRIPNSSYKILGHIPDISGHGNHGVIHNSAYKLNSGANGYLVDFQTEVLNLVRAKIEGSPEGKALLDSQLKLVKNLKTSIIEMSQREMQLFNAFKEASAKNPSLTYDEFIKTMK